MIPLPGAVLAGGGKSKTALEVVEFCWGQIQSPSLSLQEKQDFAAVGFTTLATGMAPLYHKEGHSSLPHNLAGRPLQLETADPSLTTVQIMGLSKTKVATNAQALLYMSITAAAAKLGVDIISIVENAQSLSTLRQRRRHLSLLHNLSKVSLSSIGAPELDNYFHRLNYSTMDAYAFLDQVIAQVAGPSITIMPDDQNRIPGLRDALTQANTHLEKEAKMKKELLLASTLLASGPVLAAQFDEPGAGVVEGKSQPPLQIQAQVQKVAKTLLKVAVTPQGDLDEFSTYAFLLKDTGPEAEHSEWRSLVTKNKDAFIELAKERLRDPSLPYKIIHLPVEKVTPSGAAPIPAPLPRAENKAGPSPEAAAQQRQIAELQAQLQQLRQAQELRDREVAEQVAAQQREEEERRNREAAEQPSAGGSQDGGGIKITHGNTILRLGGSGSFIKFGKRRS